MVPTASSCLPALPGPAQTVAQASGQHPQMPDPRQAVRPKRGRKSWPLGQPVEGTVLRGPPGLVRGTAWPVSVAKAKRAIDLIRSGERVPHDQTTRGMFRSAISVFNLAAALAHRGMNARPRRDGEDDLLEAFQLFQAISAAGNAHHFQKYRAVALYNATQCVNALPLRCAQGLAATLLLRAVEAVGDAALAELKHVVHDLGSRVVEKPAPVPVKWKGPTLLVPDHPEAGRRIFTVDRPITGTWEAIRGALLTHGLVAPEKCLAPNPLVEVRRGRGALRVS